MSDANFIFWIGRIRKALRGEFEARAAELEIFPGHLLHHAIARASGRPGIAIAADYHMIAGY